MDEFHTTHTGEAAAAADTTIAAAAAIATPSEHIEATHTAGPLDSVSLAAHASAADESASSSHLQPVRSRSRTPSPPPPTVLHTVSLVVQPATQPSVGSMQLPLPPPIAPAKAAEARLHSPQPAAVQLPTEAEDDDDASDDSDTDSALSDEGEVDLEEGSGSSKQPAPFVPFLPRPLLFCLTLVGCTFVFASLLLLFGMRSWGIREERVALYNRAVDEWSAPGGYATQMAHARFGLLDLRKHTTSDSATEDPGAATLEPASRFGNDTWLLPVQQQTLQEGQVESTSAAANDDETASDAALAASAASAAAPATRNINGLRDLGSDVRSYSPFYHELLFPSPISWDSSARDLAPDRYWSRLLTHDSRTLYLDTLLDGRRTSIFNLTIPFLKRETLSEHLTKHSCESGLSGMWDRRNKRCTFFAQLHAVCLRVRVLEIPASAATNDPASADPAAAATTQQVWSLDAKDVGFGIVPAREGDTEADQAPQTEPLTSLFISPPSAARAASNDTALDVSGVAGCIWNEISREFTVGEYHAVDIRSEHEIDDSDALDEAGDAEARAALRKRLELESLLRLTLKSAHDPFLLAQSLTSGILWFGLAKTEKILLSVVLGSVGALFLLAPTFVVATQYGWIRRKKYKGSRRARKGGYTSVVAPDAASLASVAGGGALKAKHKQQQFKARNRSSVSSPASPSTDALMSIDDADADDDDAARPCSIELSPYSGRRNGSDASAAGNGSAGRDGTAGFVPSEALRKSLVASPSGSEPSASPPASSVAAPGSSPSAAASTSRKSIRIDPTPHYHPPRFSPPSPSRSTPRRAGLLSKKGLEATARAIALPGPAAGSLHRSAASKQRPKADRSLSKVLRGNFSFANLLAAWSGSNGGGARGKNGKRAADDDDEEEEEAEDEEESKQQEEEPTTPTPSMQIGRALSLAALQEQKRNAHSPASALHDLASPISPIPAPAATAPSDSTLTPWSSPRE